MTDHIRPPPRGAAPGAFAWAHTPPRTRGKRPHRSDPDAPRRLLAYWSGLRHHGEIPRRADLDPRQLGPLLPDMLLLERIAPGVARMRVAGTQVCAHLGLNLRGMPLSVLFARADRSALGPHIEALFAGPATLEMTLTAPAGLARPARAGRLLLLPLLDGEGEVTRAVGVLVCQGSSDTRLRRFQLEGCETRAVPDLPVTHSSEYAGPAARVPYLRLVHST